MPYRIPPLLDLFAPLDSVGLAAEHRRVVDDQLISEALLVDSIPAAKINVEPDFRASVRDICTVEEVLSCGINAARHAGGGAWKGVMLSCGQDLHYST